MNTPAEIKYFEADMIPAMVRAQNLGSDAVGLAENLTHIGYWGKSAAVYLDSARGEIARMRATLDFIAAAIGEPAAVDPAALRVIDLAWVEINALGGTFDPANERDAGYDEALGKALAILEKLGGKDVPYEQLIAWQDRTKPLPAGAPDGQMVAEVCPLVGHAQARRNARVVAAAPDLLAVCQELVGADSDGTWETDRAWLVETALVAIAKAEAK